MQKQNNDCMQMRKARGTKQKQKRQSQTRKAKQKQPIKIEIKNAIAKRKTERSQHGLKKMQTHDVSAEAASNNQCLKIKYI